MLRIHQISDQRLGDVETQRIKRGRLRRAACGSAPTSRRSTGLLLRGVQTNVEEVGNDQGQEEASQQPQRKRSPEGSVDQNKQVGNPDWNFRGVDCLNSRDGGEVSQGPQILDNAASFEEQHQGLDGFHAAQ